MVGACSNNEWTTAMSRVWKKQESGCVWRRGYVKKMLKERQKETWFCIHGRLPWVLLHAAAKIQLETLMHGELAIVDATKTGDLATRHSWNFPKIPSIWTSSECQIIRTYRSWSYSERFLWLCRLDWWRSDELREPCSVIPCQPLCMYRPRT